MVLSQDFKASLEGNPLTNAFKKRISHMPGTAMSPVPPEKTAACWEELKQEERVGPSVMYLHVPFCANHCLFCGFYINKWQGDVSRAYADALIKELYLEVDSPSVGTAPINAVYFGGGTPTALEAHDLARIIKEIRRLYPLAPDCEITVEGRIYHFDEEKITACLEAGANRFSIGVQSFDDKTRRRMGRKVSGSRAIEFFNQLSDMNQAAVICDLMLGLPYQTQAVWQNDLDTVSSLNLDGVDLYALSLFPGTPLDLAIKKGACESAATMQEQAEMYGQGWEQLRTWGWHQLSSSHWAKTTRERNLYNRLIKTGAHTLAFGSGAGGMLNGQSYALERNLQNYYDLLAHNQKPLARLLTPDPLAKVFNSLSAAVENMHLDFDLIGKSHPLASDYLRFIQPMLENWVQAGLITTDKHPRLTKAGCFWHSTLLVALKSSFKSFLAEQETLLNLNCAN